MPLTLRTISVTSSLTPGIVDISCRTPSILMLTTATPGSELEQYSSQRISESNSVSALQRLDNELTALAVFAQINGRNIGLLYFYHSNNTSFDYKTQPLSYCSGYIRAALGLLLGIQFDDELLFEREVVCRRAQGARVTFAACTFVLVKLKPLRCDNRMPCPRMRPLNFSDRAAVLADCDNVADRNEVRTECCTSCR